MNPEPKIEVKSVRHSFTSDERNELGGNLARSIGTLRSIEADFDQVKAGYKAKTAEAEARIDNLSTALVNGFEIRAERCVVKYRPKEREKDYFLESQFRNGETSPEALILTEAMTDDDFQAELIQAESKFDCREEIALFQSTESDNGVLIVGCFAGKWFSALRVKIGKLGLTERLDSEQRSFKKRHDAVTHAVKRVNDWAKENLKEHARGFSESFQAVIEAHKARVE